MIRKICLAFQYYTERMRIHKNEYAIHDIFVEHNGVVLQYYGLTGFSSAAKSASAREVFLLREEFNRIDRFKIDAANLAQDMLDILHALDIPDQQKQSLIDAYTVKISQYLGVAVSS